MGNSDPPDGIESTRGGASPTLKPKPKKSKKDLTKEAIVLVPLTYNDGTTIDPDLLAHFFDQAFLEFAGWTVEGEIRGAYKMASGEKRVERSLKVSIILEESRLPVLENLVGQWASELGQEEMLLKITDYVVRFVPPLKWEE